MTIFNKTIDQDKIISKTLEGDFMTAYSNFINLDYLNTPIDEEDNLLENIPENFPEDFPEDEAFL